MSWVQSLLKVAIASRPPSWVFGPILFGIGIIHSQRIPTTLPALALAALQVFSLSIPLSIREYAEISALSSFIHGAQLFSESTMFTTSKPTAVTRAKLLTGSKAVSFNLSTTTSSAPQLTSRRCSSLGSHCSRANNKIFSLPFA